MFFIIKNDKFEIAKQSYVLEHCFVIQDVKRVFLYKTKGKFPSKEYMWAMPYKIKYSGSTKQVLRISREYHQHLIPLQ